MSLPLPTSMPIDDAERYARLRLIRTPGLGPSSFGQLLHRFGSAVEALAHLPTLNGRHGQPWIAPPPASIDRELARLDQLGARLIFAGCPPYPEILAAVPNAPPVLAAIGKRAWLNRPAIALVGARNASAAGLRIAAELAEALNQAGYAIVSGLARGIDGAVHQAALPATIAVVAHGHGRCFPPEHQSLQEQIQAQGLVLSEAPPDAEPVARAFPARNRIIAGLALATIVVEATRHSGSLITARLATELGREVMAVPGHPLEMRAQGPNALIRDGATLVQNADDVLEALAPIDPRAFQPNQKTAPRHPVHSPGSTSKTLPETGVGAPMMANGDWLSLITHVPIDPDDLVRLSGQSAADVNRTLVRLELDGHIVRHAGGRIARG